MSQVEIIDYLKKNPEQWHTAGELSNILNVSKGSISTNMMRLRKFDFKNIEFKKEIESNGHRKKLIFIRWTK